MSESDYARDMNARFARGLAANSRLCAEWRKREAKERYQDWLRADSGLPFMEWLQRRAQRA